MTAWGNFEVKLIVSAVLKTAKLARKGEIANYMQNNLFVHVETII